MTPLRLVYCALFVLALVSGSTAYAQDAESPYDASHGEPSRNAGLYCAPINPNLILIESDFIGSPPSTELTVTRTQEGGPVVLFDASGSSDPDGQVVSWNWEFGDGTLGSGQRVEHTYSEPGTYNVELIVTDNVGNRMRHLMSERVDVVADIGVSCTASGVVIDGQRVIDLVIVVSNDSPFTIRKVRVQAEINRFVVASSWNSFGGEAKVGNDVVIVDYPTMTPYGRETISIRVTKDCNSGTGTTMDDWVRVNSAAPDWNRENDTCRLDLDDVCACPVESPLTPETRAR